jgi:hypothetical protein
MPSSWTLAVARTELGRTTLVQGDVPEPADGEAVLRVDRVGMTANNVTYAVLGDGLRYWEFFPPEARGLDREWGLVPLWGFCEVAASRTDGVTVGQRLYGYLPPAEHLVVRPGRVDERGFRETSDHRAGLPSPYNRYTLTTGDTAYRAEDEDLLILFRPLFLTSYLLADQLADNDFHGAQALLLSSASSKTAYAAAFELRGTGPALVGLTSPRNLEFTRSLGCYDDVVTYDEIGELDTGRPAAYVDFSGSAATRAAIRERFGDSLVHDVAVGLTNQVGDLGAAGAFFFAPEQMRKRTTDWGRDVLDTRVTEAWRRFAAAAEAWVDVTVGHGPDALRAAWLETLAGQASPRTGHVVAL